jgi:hypothetical protein
VGTFEKYGNILRVRSRVAKVRSRPQRCHTVTVPRAVLDEITEPRLPHGDPWTADVMIERSAADAGLLCLAHQRHLVGGVPRRRVGRPVAASIGQYVSEAWITNGKAEKQALHCGNGSVRRSFEVAGGH